MPPENFTPTVDPQIRARSSRSRRRRLRAYMDFNNSIASTNQQKKLAITDYRSPALITSDREAIGVTFDRLRE